MKTKTTTQIVSVLVAIGLSAVVMQRSFADDVQNTQSAQSAKTDAENKMEDAKTDAKKNVRNSQQDVRKATGTDSASKDVEDSAKNVRDEAAGTANKAQNDINNNK
jgi:hypothetical protein